MESIKVYKVVCVGSSKGLLVKMQGCKNFFWGQEIQGISQKSGKVLDNVSGKSGIESYIQADTRIVKNTKRHFYWEKQFRTLPICFL